MYLKPFRGSMKFFQTHPTHIWTAEISQGNFEPKLWVIKKSVFTNNLKFQFSTIESDTLQTNHYGAKKRTTKIK